jgi:hypothetical protein
VIVAAPILVEELSESWAQWSRSKPRDSVAAILRDLGSEFSGGTLRATIWAPVMIVGLTVSMVNGSTDTWPDNFAKVKFPIALIEQYQETLVPTAKPIPRTFTSDQWSDYLTYRFYPRIKIFMDGRSDFFGAEIGKQYIALANGRHDWEQVLDRYRIDMALLPVEWPLTELLKRNAGWKIIKDDKMAILFERRTPVLTPVLMKSAVSAEGSTSNTRSLL